MSVKQRDLVRYLEESGFYLLREGGNPAIYTNDHFLTDTTKDEK
jgi:mRNA interferase HicA